MSFGEKLLKLRKEKGYSQEALAERLNTTRQAVSKWENGQGYPETEKLLIIGTIFEVSMDYLLKDSGESHLSEEEGYYVSKEMAEGFLLNQRRLSKTFSLSFSLFILSVVPYLVFENPAVYAFLIIVIAALGVIAFVAAVSGHDERYKPLTKETLLLDHNYLKELASRYDTLKKRYTAFIGAGACLIAIGGLAFLLERKEIAQGALVPYYPVCVVMIALGMYMLIRTVTVLGGYSLLVNNHEYVNKWSHRLKRKMKQKLEGL